MAVAEFKNGLYELSMNDCQNYSLGVCKIDVNNGVELWHRRLGHIGLSGLKKLVKISAGLSMNSFDMDLCEACALSKGSRKPFQKSNNPSTDKLEIIAGDLLGPLEVKSIGGARYILVLVDNYSKYNWVIMLKQKSDAFQAFKHFKSRVENETGRRIKVFRSDNGGEFTSKQFESFLKVEGILHQKTVPYTPEQNGTVERMNRTIMEKVRAMLYESGLPKTLWREAAVTASYLINRSPATSTGLTPYEVWHGTQPDLSHLRIFGSKCFTHIPKQLRKKLDAKCQLSYFVGYDAEAKGYRVWNDASGKVNVCRDIMFDEGIF